MSEARFDKPRASTAGDAGREGSDSASARADHVHDRTADLTSSPTTLIIPGATSPAQTAEGSAVWDTNDDLLTVGTGSTRKTMVDTDSTQTLSSKTLSAPTLTGTTTAAAIDASGLVHGGGGGPGNAFQIGDDCYLSDINVANAARLTGVQNSATAKLQFGVGGPAIDGSTSGPLGIDRNTEINGYLYTYSSPVIAGLQNGTDGRIVLNAGYANSSGYVGFYSKDTYRQGYIGNSSTNNSTPDTGRLEYHAGEHEISGNVLLGSRDITAWNTYTPTLTNITTGTVSGKWKYINQHAIYVMIAITAGTITTGGTAVTATLPGGVTVDTFMDQPLSARFNAAAVLEAHAVQSGTTISISGSDADGTALANGTSFANVRVAGVIAVQ